MQKKFHVCQKFINILTKRSYSDKDFFNIYNFLQIYTFSILSVTYMSFLEKFTRNQIFPVPPLRLFFIKILLSSLIGKILCSYCVFSEKQYSSYYDFTIVYILSLFLFYHCLHFTILPLFTFYDFTIVYILSFSLYV